MPLAAGLIVFARLELAGLACQIGQFGTLIAKNDAGLYCAVKLNVSRDVFMLTG